MSKRGIENGYSIPAETPGDLFAIARAFEASRAFHIANNIEVFTGLAGGALTLADLSERTGVDSSALEKVLLVAVSIGLLLTDGMRFSNSLIAEKYLVRGKPEYIGDAIWLTGGWWSPLNDLGNEVFSQYRAKHDVPEGFAHERFIEAMHDYAVDGEADRLADALDLGGRKRLLDVGGGPGTMSVFLCRKYPELSATILDLPETEPIFKRVVDSYGMAQRVTFRVGDIEQVPFGEGYDVVLVSSMMHGSRGDLIPPKAFDALVPGGLIIIRDFVLYPEKNGPLSAALFNMRMGAYTEDELFDFLHKAGFVDIGCQELGDFTLVTGRKAGMMDPEIRKRAREAVGFADSGLTDLAENHDKYFVEAIEDHHRR